MRAPSLEMDSARRRAFDHVLTCALRQGVAAPVACDDAYPKCEFLRYLVDVRGYLLHGSRERDIQVFEPRPASDVNPFSAQRAVYAASDGIWPMVFAIRDRRPGQGTFYNGCTRVVYDDASRGEPYYHFAMAAAGLRERPWCAGMMYVLPRQTFVPHPLLEEDGIRFTLEEWASPEAVHPVAKLEVEPADFPFLDAFWGYDPARMPPNPRWTDLDHTDTELFPIQPSIGRPIAE